MIGWLILVLAINAAVTYGTHRAYQRKGTLPVGGQALFIVQGLLLGIPILLAALVFGIRDARRDQALEEAERQAKIAALQRLMNNPDLGKKDYTH